MPTFFLKNLKTLLFVITGFVSLPAFAGPYTSLVIFGDSLSDTGNVYAFTGGAEPPAGQPYFNGRFSNGPLWVETLAAGLGLAADAAPYIFGGNNYAFAGASSDASFAPPLVPPGLLMQIGGLWAPSHPLADPGALYVIAAGSNDMLDAGDSSSTAATRQAAAMTSYLNLLNGAGFLATMGAKNILIANLPDLGLTPEASFLGLQAQYSDAAMQLNALIATLPSTLESSFTGLNIDTLDIFGLNHLALNDALFNGGAIYGITNVFAPCAGFIGSLGDSCDVSLFSDALHPSARAHALLGDAALNAVPLPSTLSIFALGLLVLTFTAKINNRQHLVRLPRA